MPRSHFDHCANPHFLKALLNNFECIPDSFVQTMKMSFQTKCWEGSKWLRIPDSWLCNRWQFNFLSSLFKEWKQWMNCKLRRCKLSNNSVIAKIARCLTFKEKVSSYGASEASYVYISSGKSSLKMPMTSFWSSMSNSVTRQVNLLIGRKLVKNAKLWNSNETIWTIFKQCEIVSISILLFKDWFFTHNFNFIYVLTFEWQWTENAIWDQ